MFSPLLYLYVYMKYIILFLLIFNQAYAQYFVKKPISLGVDKADGAFSIRETSRGNFLLSGSSYFFNPNPVTSGICLQVDSQGIIIDTLEYNHNSFGLDVIFDAIDLQNHLWLLGRFYSPGKNDYDTYLIKSDTNLRPLSIYVYDFGYAEEMRFLFIDTIDNTLLLLGYEYHNPEMDSSQIILAKIDTAGNVLMKKEYGGPGYDFAYHMLFLPDGGYMLTGEMTAHPYPNNTVKNLFILKLDTDFNYEWSKYYGSQYTDRAGFSRNSILTADSGIIMVGWQHVLNHPTYYKMAYVFKVDLQGNIIWEKYHRGGSGHFIVEHHSILPTTDGNFYITGYLNETFSSLHTWVMKIDMDGNILWERFHKTGIQDDSHYVWDATLNPHGGVAMTGFVIYQGPQSNDIIFITTDSCGYTDGDVASAELFYEGLNAITYRFMNNGSQYCSTHWNFGDGTSSNLPQYTHTYTAPGTYTVTLTSRAGNAVDVKTAIVKIPDVFNSIEETQLAALSLYPNPASTQLKLSGSLPLSAGEAVFELFNTAGKTVLSTSLPTGDISQNINIRHLPEGLYGYRIISEKRMWHSGRVAVVR